ncbi:MAG: flagellar biosynthesis anti-sigma factor FlgM [Clostridiaceae bacterium]|nr:flagellar biosynthesis anti-sigma factor FlgM [Clostridiaceae bacterium]
MKIWGNNPKVFGVYNKQNPIDKIQKNNIVSSGKDEYKISEQAKEYQIVMKALAKIPDIREDKVKEISAKIESGEYRVEAEDISDKIIRMLINEKE